MLLMVTPDCALPLPKTMQLAPNCSVTLPKLTLPVVEFGNAMSLDTVAPFTIKLVLVPFPVVVTLAVSV